MAIRFDEIQLASAGNHLYPTLSNGGGNGLRIQSSTGYGDFGSGNTSYFHISTDRGSFYFSKPVTFDGNISAYGGDENLTNWSNVDASAFRSKGNTAYLLDPTNTGTSLNVAGAVASSNINTSIKYLGVGQNYDTDRTTKVTSGVALYGAYNGGSNSPHTYDFSAQFVGNARGFELSAAWHSQTRLKIRSLRDCCQNWSSFYDIAIHGLNNQAGDLYASKYYDESSTGYYLDPGNTSISLNVAGNIETQGALKTKTYLLFDNDGDFTGGNYYTIQDTSANRLRIAYGFSATDNLELDSAGNFYVNGGSVTVNGNITASDITATHFGIANSSSGSRDGIALYGGATGGEPTYGLLFTGTSLGTHGGVTGNWATYFTMNNDTSRGWIFRRVGSGNSASISAGGVARFDNSVISPKFYDTSGTTYYLDLDNNGSVALKARGSILSYDSGGGNLYLRSEQSRTLYGSNTYENGVTVLTNQATTNYATFNTRGVTAAVLGNTPWGTGSASSGKDIFNIVRVNQAAYGPSTGKGSFRKVLNLRGNGNLYLGHVSNTGAVYATVYYDKASTTRYVDPGSTGDSIRVSGDVVAYYSSDKRLKNNIKPIDKALDKVNSISGVTFEWNEKSHKQTGKKDIGVIAQEVEEILPEVVETRTNGYKAVDYQKLTALLIESVKELTKEVQDLKSQINK
jgi:hypothetical protein